MRAGAANYQISINNIMTTQNKTKAVDPGYARFKVWQREAGWSTGRIADELGIGRCYLSVVLNGGRKNCRGTWERLVAGLPMEGLEFLEQCRVWNVYAAAAMRKRRAEERIAEIAGVAS